MGASRKLQGEIDRVLKKVQEGVDVFDSIWNKVYDTDNANQKEKFEADLKKEIKKLQRYRDQIKTWIQSSEIKDKKVSASYEQALMDARKLIEREMERFKICEKETKTKAFSKEGLGQQPKTDPKEKAKSDTRDWINNVVSELESQIDSFEAEMEGLTVKKGKTRPPRLTHLESSITRHKAHIMKLELILRLLDNDELSPEQVNDVKDFLDDYVERNQDDFEEFSDVDELYNSLPLEKVESLEDLVAIGPPGLVKGVGATSAILSLKTSLTTSSAQPLHVVTNQQGSSVQEQVEETVSQDSTSDIVPKTLSKISFVGASAPTTITGSHATGSQNATAHILVPGVSTASATLTGPTPARGVLEDAAAVVSAAPVSISVSTKQEEVVISPGRKALSETGQRGVGRDSLTSPLSTSNPLSSGGTILSDGAVGALAPSGYEIAKRNVLGTDDRLTGTGIVQPMVSPLSNKVMLPQAAKADDMTDSGNISEAAGMGFSPSVVPGVQWRPGSSFQSQNETGQFRGRTEIAPDQREKFLQRFQQVQQQGQSTMLGMPPLSGVNHKQFSSQQHNPLLQQFNSQSSTTSSLVGLGVGVQAPGLNAVTSSLQLQSNPTLQQQLSQLGTMSASHIDSEIGHTKAEELQHQQILSDDLAVEFATSTGVVKNLMNEDDPKTSYASDTPVIAGVTNSEHLESQLQGEVNAPLTETAQMAKDIDFSPRQPLQSNKSSGNLGVIGRRSVSDRGAIGDNLGGPSLNYAGMHDQLYNLQMLDSAYYKLPQPKDSERAKSYTPRHPVVTPSSYPQVQAPIVNNPAFWERLGADNYGTDTLFFAFYYQQNTYQQYLAAKELKKQSWRFHKKYNTWFQRHEEPKLATDDYEQGTYVYFDFHITDESHNGWCQRIKNEFRFEYNYLEDELIM